MKKKIVLFITIIATLVVLCCSFCSCSSSAIVDEEEFAKQKEYYDGIADDAKSCASTLDSLVSKLKSSTVTFDFIYEDYYYSSARDNKNFKGTETNPGYNNNEDKTGEKWMVASTHYTIKVKGNKCYIKAEVNKDATADDYENGSTSKLRTSSAVYADWNSTPTLTSGENAAADCFIAYDVLFGTLVSSENLINYAANATKGNKITSKLLQYTTGKAFPYAEDGTIDESTVLNYTQNKGLIKYTSCEEHNDKNSNGSYKGIYFTYDGKNIDMAGDKVTYWDAYGDDITYNLYKTAAIYNDRVTFTYGGDGSELKIFEYYGEKVLPFYTRKSKFQTYNVLKAVVGEYYHIKVNDFNYDSSVTIPSSL